MGRATAQRTPFDGAFRAIAGAAFEAVDGWETAADFGDPVAEHRAVREGCGVCDASPLRKWDVRGPGAALAVERFFTNEMGTLQRGQLRYGAFCDDDGMMLGDGIAFRFADQEFGLVTRLETDGEAFAEAAGDAEYELKDVTADAPHLQLQGPDSRTVLESLARRDLGGLRYYRFLPEPVLVGGVPVSIARCGYTGELGYELYTEPAHAGRLLDAIIGTRRVRPYGMRAMETLRREAGLILLGLDFEPGASDPFELGLDRVVRLAKPAFRGRDALLRRSAGGLARRLASLAMDGEEPPAPGAEVRASGRAVGDVRSAGPAPTVGRPVALAVLETSEIEVGRRVEIDGQGARVTTHPAYDPEKLRPRS